MKVFFVFLLVLVFGVVSSHGLTNEYNTVATKLYDEFFLVQQWPASFCRVNQCLSIPPYFTVHGLWAQLKRGQAVTCDEETFKISEVLYDSQLKHNTLSDLNKYWPNLKGENDEFWTYEYHKHASCISPFQNDQDKYFSLTLNLAKKYNVTTMLLKAGIQPGMKHYSISKIKNAILGAINVKPTLQCNKAKDGTFQLFQIYLCIDKTTFTPQNCRIPFKNCRTQNANSPISFPPPWCPIPSLPVFFSSTGNGP